MYVSNELADRWTLDDYMRMLQFQIEAYHLCKKRDYSSLMAFNLSAISMECYKIHGLISEMNKCGGIKEDNND